MSLPPAFSQSFFRRLAAFAEEFNMSRTTFVSRAINHYAEELRKRKSVPAKTLGADAVDKYVDLVGKVSRSWWAKVSPEEKRARAKKAAAARWAKKQEEEPPAE
jgi:hypothetical protein